MRLWRVFYCLVLTNYFALFALKSDFCVDLSALESAYQTQIAQFHPDKFATQNPQKQTIALQNTALINTAYDTLKSPLKRATYLLELSNINAFDEKDTQMDADFLMAQIEYRQALERLEIDENINEIEGFIGKMDILEKQYITDISQFFKAKNLEKVKQNVRELRFYQQLKNHANELLDEL